MTSKEFYSMQNAVSMEKLQKKWKPEPFEINRQRTDWKIHHAPRRQLEDRSEDINLNEQRLNNEFKAWKKEFKGQKKKKNSERD